MMAGLLMVLALAVPTCHTINDDRIFARNLAEAIPAFASLPKDLVVGLAPFPGQQRAFRPGELRRIALANKMSESEFADTVCFSWAMSLPSMEKLRAAMEKTLGERQAQIEIAEQSLTPAPDGEIVFPLRGLSGTSDGPVLWRGFITYADKKVFNIWARVKVTVHEPHVVANQVLKPGDEIRPEQLRIDQYDGPLQHEQPFTSLASVVGLTPRNSIAAGLALTKDLLRERNDVERGDFVQVVVELHQTHVEAQGVAEESGQRGGVISIRNASSGRRFRGRIEGKGRVLVLPEGPTGLVTEEARREASN